MDSLRAGDTVAYERQKVSIISWLLRKEVGCVVFMLAAPDLQSNIAPGGTIPEDSAAAQNLKVCPCVGVSVQAHMHVPLWTFAL